MKKINLIKRLWTDSHEKQKPQRFVRYAVMLMMLLTLGVGQMRGKVVYYNNAGNSNTPKIHFWGGDYPSAPVWASDPEMNQVGTSDIYWYEIGDNNLCIFRYYNGSWQQTDDLDVPSDYKNYYTDSDWDWYWPMTDLAPILNGTKIMVYGGVLNNWGQSNYYFTSGIDGSDVAATATKLTLSKNINSTGDSWYGATSIAGGEYYQGHWASGFKCTVEAGYAYIVRGTTSDAHFSAQCNESGGNNLYKVLKAGSTDPTTTLTTTIGASTIGVGTSTLSVSTSGSAGKSVMDIDNVMYYYLHNGNTSTWSQVTLSTGNLDISALSAGHYKLATLLSDGNICVRADLDEFDVYDTWAMYSGSTKVADFTTTDGVNYTVTDLVINNDNNTNTRYKCSGNASYAQAGANSLCVAEANALTLTFDDGQINWVDGNGTYDIHIKNVSGTWKIYAEKTANEETWYWIDGNGAHDGHEDVTKQQMSATAVSGVYSTTRSLTQNQTFHFGNTNKGYGPNSTARGANAYASVTSTSSNIGLDAYGSVYWFQFTPASQPVIMTLNTNTDPYTISFSNPVYTITYYDQGGSAFSGTQAGAPTTHTYGTATNLKIPTRTGYDFAGWYTVSDCSSGAVGTSSAASLSATGYTANINLYAKWTEKTYTITLVNATAASVTAGIETNPTITAATKWGATFDHWEATDGIEITNENYYTTTISASKAGTVTAVYTQTLFAYVVGRFKSYSKDRQSSYYTGNWNTTATNNEFEYEVANDRFVLHTYAKPSELSANIDSEGQYFEIKTTEDEGDLEDASVEYFGKTSNVDLSSPGYEDHKIEMEKSKATGHPKFNSSTSDKYVVLYFKKVSSTYYLWYEEETIPAAIDEVNLSASRVPPTAPITATPTMYDISGIGNKAYCWGVYTDEECTSKVNSVTFSSLGDGKVQFMAPQEQGTYYLKLTVHSTDDCNATIDDEEVVSFTVTTSQMVFFKNVPGWGNVHFYFLGGEYWDNNKGSGCAGRDGGAARGMTRIGNSDIYYYDYSSNSVMNTYMGSNSTAHIAFTDNYKPNANNFSGCQAAYRGDFSACATMYVPENYITDYKNTSAGDGQAAYYNRGYWTNYMSANSGFSLYIWDQTTSGSGDEVTHHEMTGTIGNNSYTFTYNFANDPNNHSMPYIYGFKAVGCGGSYYGAGSTMDMTDCTDWNLGTGTNNCGLKVAAKLEHKFILTLAGDGHVQVSVEYPVNVGDYRLLYNDNTQDHPHPSQYIRMRANGKDTVAMFIRPSETENLKVQYCTGIDGETITWEDYEWNSGSAAINVSGKADGVYVFYLEQDGSGNFNNVSNIEPYSGKYYIRTNCLDGGWNSYKSSDDNLMTYAQYPEDRGYGFNYYKAKWVGSTGTDVTYTIACDYSPSLCDTLTADPGDNPLSASEAASLPHTANIRFGWHSKTNQLKREYINGSTNVSDRYLVMIGDEKLMDENGDALAISGLNDNEISFTDLNNWIYRCDVTAVEGAAVKLTANYDSHVQYFIGDEDETEEIIGGSGEKPYVMRVTYDFKTNRLMTAWLPNGSEIESDVVLNADMMLIREGQNAATQVYFNGNSHSISNIHTIYGVMEFKYDHMVGKFPNWNADGAYEYLMYYISFPFDVKVSEIFGCGVRGENWIIQKYNGAKRAQIGWFKGDGTTTFWETMEGNETMNAYEGYLLLLDRVTFNDPSSSLWYKQGSDNSIYLYFPSKSVASGTISEDDKIIHVPEHTCTINRTFTVDGVAGTLNHMNTDSHWNIMGTPLFETKTASTIGTPSADGAGATTLQYYYRWNKADNTLSVRSALSTSTEFLSMHAYMVQYAGDVTFHGAKLTPPSSVAARRVLSDKNYRIELQMVNANGKSSETFVELRENACDTFALNEDMYMVRSSNMVDLYTFAGAYDVAANVLSVNNHIVPVGMDVKQAGTYRFTMPSAFSGTVTLIDTQAGARTNLALGDYEVNLEKGTLNNRFQLEINIQASTTSLEGNDVKDGGAHKFIENGAMYILKNGEIFDVYGNHVR